MPFIRLLKFQKFIYRNTAYSLVRSGQIQVLRVGRQIRIPRSEVIRFLSSAL